MERPIRSPWGKVQVASELAPGVWTAATASRGGVKVSKLRNKAIPEYMRNINCWYEEDIEWCIVALVHPSSFPGDEDQKTAKDTLRNWLPDSYAKFYNVDITTLKGKSHRYDDYLHLIAHVDDWVGVCAYRDWHEHVPEGMVGVVANKAGCANRGFLVPKEEYDKRGNLKFVIDLEKHKVWDYIASETKRLV